MRNFRRALSLGGITAILAMNSNSAFAKMTFACGFTLRSAIPVERVIVRTDKGMQDYSGHLEFLYKSDIDGSSVFLLSDRRGRVSIIDERYIEDRRAAHPDDLADREPIAAIDREKFKEETCSKLSELRKHPQFDKLRKYFKKNAGERELGSLKKYFQTYCNAAGRSFGGAWAFWTVFTLAKVAQVVPSNYIGNHSSNFYIGIGMWNTFHSCTMAETPFAHAKAWAMVLGAATFNDVVLESLLPIAMKDDPNPIPFVGRGGHPDWDDIGSTQLGVVVTALYTTYLERSLGFDLALFCAK